MPKVGMSRKASEFPELRIEGSEGFPIASVTYLKLVFQQGGRPVFVMASPLTKLRYLVETLAEPGTSLVRQQLITLSICFIRTWNVASCIRFDTLRCWSQ